MARGIAPPTTFGKTTMMDQWNRHRGLPPDGASLERDTRDRNARRRDIDSLRKEKLDEALDRGLEESFPGSDPVSVVQPPSSVYDRHEAHKR
jgi:hypothetical protein